MACISGLVRLTSPGSDQEVWPLFPFERLSQDGGTVCHGSFRAVPGSEAAESRVPVSSCPGEHPGPGPVSSGCCVLPF